MLNLQVGACYLQWNQKGWRFRDPEIISFWYTLKQMKIDGFDGLIFFLLRTRGMTGILGRGTTQCIISSLEGRWTMIISPWLVVFCSFFRGWNPTHLCHYCQKRILMKKPASIYLMVNPPLVGFDHCSGDFSWFNSWLVTKMFGALGGDGSTDVFTSSHNETERFLWGSKYIPNLSFGVWMSRGISDITPCFKGFVGTYEHLNGPAIP